MKNNKQAQVFHFDVFGKRQDKYDFLDNHTIGDIEWNELQPDKPGYFLVSKDFEGISEYEKGFKIDEIFKIYNNGIETGKDSFFYSISISELRNKLKESFDNKEDTFFKYNITNTTDYKFKDKFSKAIIDIEKIRFINYRPFDIIPCYYDEIIQRRPAYGVMKQMLFENIALLTPRQVPDKFNHIFISKYPTDCNLTGTAKKFGSAPIFPLYIYPETNAQQNIGKTTKRTPNLNTAIVNQLAEKLSLTFVPEKEPEGNVCFINNAEVRPDFKTTFAPIDILDYIYAVLHSPTYREKYKEFLKIDFPRVPFPKNVETFWQLIELGGEIRQIHLLEAEKVNQFITSYPNDGNNTVTRKMTTASPGWEAANTDKTFGRVWINDQQFFDGVPLIAWEFYIGGYQPAQKWLKDRHGRTLNFEDILHYQKIIVALTETHRLMQEVDKIGVE